MKKFTTSETRFLVFILMMVLLSIFSKAATAQTVVTLQGDGTYKSLSTRTTSQDKATGKILTLSDGQKLPIFETAKGKYYVIRISKKTGKEYRQYLKVE